MRTLHLHQQTVLRFSPRENFVSPFMEVVPVSEFELEFVNVCLHSDSNIDFSGLDDKERTDCGHECNRLSACQVPAPLRPMAWVSLAMVIAMDATAESITHRTDDAFMGHADHGDHLVSDMNAIGQSKARNSDHAFSIKQSGSVGDIHHLLQARNENVANSGDIRCPARKGAEGQSRAKQAERLGVCNEHVPRAEAKICSGLGRNVERSAEMTGPSGVFISNRIHWKVTDRNTDTIFLRYAPKRLFKPLEKVQSINQDAMVQLITFAGNMTTSNAKLNGVLKA